MIWCQDQWERIPTAMRSVMDKSTWDLAWQMGWAGGMKEMQKVMENTEVSDGGPLTPESKQNANPPFAGPTR